MHGAISLPKVCKHIIDHKYFQRMRRIKQLGMCHYVFPGATHTRFAHSIGTACLASRVLQKICLSNLEGFDGVVLEKNDIYAVIFAALCHDLGHPCFSHMFEVFCFRLSVH